MDERLRHAIDEAARRRAGDTPAAAAERMSRAVAGAMGAPVRVEAYASEQQARAKLRERGHEPKQSTD